MIAGGVHSFCWGYFFFGFFFSLDAPARRFFGAHVLVL